MVKKNELILLLKTISFYNSFRLYNSLKDDKEDLITPLIKVIEDKLPELLPSINNDSNKLDNLIEKGLIAFTIDSLNLSQAINYDETVASLIPYLENYLTI